MKSLLIIAVILGVSLCVSAFNLEIDESQKKVKNEIKQVVEVVEMEDETETTEADNLCAQLNCGPGETCKLDDGVLQCACIEDCGDVKDERLMVCSSSNVTFDSECHFYREKCWCSKEDNKCTKRNAIKDNVEYFGKCQAVDKCTDEQKEVFPIRMKLWLDEVLNHLSKVKDVETEKTYSKFIQLAKETKKDQVERHWIYGVMFEFCNLDKSHDGVLNSEEMKELVIPIKALENCIQPFLQECDLNKDAKITDTEWGQCLDLSEADLLFLRESCKY